MIHKAVINLLLLIMAVQPVLAFGQFTAEMTEPLSLSGEMATMGCCDTGLARTAGHPEDNLACGDMASADCVLAANLGSCGTMLSALVPEKAVAPRQSAGSATLVPPLDRYLSIILDTLTPPPNTSKA